jgi:DNA-binding XRE family transcriptional regulator
MDVKQRAHQMTTYAIKVGKLIPKTYCEKCEGRIGTVAHHPDYNKPLEVIWVCTICHARIHRGIPTPILTIKDIRTLRKEIYGTLAKMAWKLDMSPSALSQIERGKRVPHYYTRRRLARALKVTVEELGFNGAD